MITLDDVLHVWFEDDGLCITLKDGRKSKALFADYPRLLNATKEQRENYTASHYGLHWPDIDEDLSFDGFDYRRS